MITFYKGRLKKSDIEFITDVIEAGLENITDTEYAFHYINKTQGFKDISRLLIHLDKILDSLDKE